MRNLRKKAVTRLVLCAAALIASIVFAVLIVMGRDTTSGSAKPSAKPGDAVSQSSSVSDSVSQPDASSAESISEDNASSDTTPEDPASSDAGIVASTEFDGLAEQPAVVYSADQQSGYTTPDDANMNLRTGPGTTFDKVTQVPAGTAVTALGANADGSWVVVLYNGSYGWLAKEYLS